MFVCRELPPLTVCMCSQRFAAQNSLKTFVNVCLCLLIWTHLRSHVYYNNLYTIICMLFSSWLQKSWNQKEERQLVSFYWICLKWSKVIARHWSVDLWCTVHTLVLFSLTVWFFRYKRLEDDEVRCCGVALVSFSCDWLLRLVVVYPERLLPSVKCSLDVSAYHMSWNRTPCVFCCPTADDSGGCS